MHKSHKKSYRAPEVKKHGELRTLTLGQTTGSKLDADFPTGTPFGDLTFS